MIRVRNFLAGMLARGAGPLRKMLNEVNNRLVNLID